jgi:hypothetical protein
MRPNASSNERFSNYDPARLSIDPYWQLEVDAKLCSPSGMTEANEPHLRLGLPCVLITCGSSTKILLTFLLALMRSKCPVNLIHLKLIVLIIGGLM